MFDFIKRINQRTVNKKTLESLAYAGGFDCFTEFHRAQFFHTPEGETAKVISIGVKDGKPVAAMEKVIISRSILTSLKFEETTPSQFREQARSMDK